MGIHLPNFKNESYIGRVGEEKVVYDGKARLACER